MFGEVVRVVRVQSAVGPIISCLGATKLVFSGRRQCVANVRLLSLQLVRTEPPFDLSLPFPARSGSLPGAACVDGGEEETYGRIRWM